MEHQERAGGRTRRRHGAEFKAELVQACRQPGVSLASVALANGVNPSLLRRWVVQSDTPMSAPALPRPAPAQPAELQFVPMTVAAGSEQPGSISIEIKRAGVSMAISWPVAEARACAALLREILR